MKVAFGHMGYSPDTFWGMSLREWQAAFKGYAEKMGWSSGSDSMSKNELKALMERYPDDRKTD